MRTWIALGAGLLVGAAYPVVDLALACRTPLSEACLLGKAYLAMNLAWSVALLGALVAGLVYGWLRWWQSSE